MISRVTKYWTILRVGIVVLQMRVALRFKRLPWVLDQATPLPQTVEPDDGAMRRLAYYVDWWLQLLPYNSKGNCFPRSVTLYRLARQRGYPVRFHCGIRKEASSMDGHAWLTLNSQVFHEPGNHWQAFTVTFSYPPDPAKIVSQGSAIRCQSLQVMEP